MSETRVVHCKRDKYDVYIGRPSLFGNPFHIGKDGSREVVLRKYSRWLFAPDQAALRNKMKSLRGLTLGCWCAPDACHGHIIAGFLDKDEGYSQEYLLVTQEP